MKASELNRKERYARFQARNGKTVLTEQQAIEHIDRSASDAKAAATVLSNFLESHHIGSAVAVSNCRRARQLLNQAVEFLDAAADHLDRQ